MMLLVFLVYCLFDTNCLIIISLYLVVSCAAYASDIEVVYELCLMFAPVLVWFSLLILKEVVPLYVMK